MCKWYLPFFLALGLLGCQTTQGLNPSLPYTLQPIPNQYANAYWLHQLEFNHKTKLLVHVEFSPKQMKMVALSATSIPVAQLSWHTEQGLTHLEKPAIPLDWQQVLRDIQWIHWPLEGVRAGLSDVISVQQQELEHGKILRQFQAQGKPVAEIYYQGKEILMINLAQDYELKVTLLN